LTKSRDYFDQPINKLEVPAHGCAEQTRVPVGMICQCYTGQAAALARMQLVIALLSRKNAHFVDELKSLFYLKRIGSLPCLVRVFTLYWDIDLGNDGLHTHVTKSKNCLCSSIAVGKERHSVWAVRALK